jgi:hypothetical protein
MPPLIFEQERSFRPTVVGNGQLSTPSRRRESMYLFGKSFVAVACLALLAAEVASAAPPANDNFASAITIGATPYTDSKSTLEATNESGEPASNCASSSYSIWYKYTAPSTGSVIADTVGSSFDTVLTAMTGSTLATLAVRACNDDSSGLSSRMPFAVTAGTTYYIRVSGYSGARGSVTFHLSSVVAPQFTQCPASGTNSGCQFLITANNDETFTVSTDPNQGPLPDGYYESHLYGVQNNSGSPLCAINVHANGGFDLTSTYGLCDTNVTPHPAMCPFGPTLYEGPGVTLTPAVTNFGAVDFSPCIPDGSSAYFSLGGFTQTAYACAEDETCGPDYDNDGVIDSLDNCPSTSNPGQQNLDGDAYGDACDPVDNTLTVKGSIKQKKDGRYAVIKGRINQSETVADIPDATGGFHIDVYDSAFTGLSADIAFADCVATEKKITCETADGLTSLKIVLSAAAKFKVPYKLKIQDTQTSAPPFFQGPIYLYLNDGSAIQRLGQTTLECVAKPLSLGCK